MSRGLARAGAVSLVGAVIGASVNLVLAVVVGRGLGPDGTGAFFQFVGLFMIAANMLELGADTGLVRFVARALATGREDQLRPLLRLAIVPVSLVGIVAGAAIMIWAPTLARLVGAPDGIDGAGLIRMLGPAVVLMSLLAVVLAATRGMGHVMPFTLLQSISLPVARVALIVTFLLAGAGVTGVLVAWLIPLPVVLVVAVAVMTRMLVTRAPASGPRRAARPAGLRREFWGFSGARGVAAGVEILLEWVDVLIVAAVLGSAEAGIYVVVTRSVRAGLVVQQASRLAVSPLISAALARDDFTEASRLYSTVTRAMLILCWPFYLTLAIFAPEVLSVFGAGFEPGSGSLTLMSLTMALALAAGMVQTVLLMGGRSTWQLADKSIALAVNVGANLLLIPPLGIMGAAVAWTATVLIDTALAAWQVHHSMGIRVRWAELVAPAVLPVAVFGVGGMAGRALVDGVAGGGLPGMLLVVFALGALYLGLCWRWRRSLGLAAAYASMRRGRAVSPAEAPATGG